jgi:hypothetical protein
VNFSLIQKKEEEKKQEIAERNKEPKEKKK